MPLDWTRDGADWPNRALSHFPSTRGVRWHVQRGGSGPRLLLLHGAGASTHSWRGLIPRLLPHFEVLAPDLPGQGFSSGAAPRFTLPGMAADIAALLKAEAFVPDLVVGHSAGAAIALRLVLDGAAQPARVIALNGALTPFRGVAGVLFPPLAKLLSLNPLTGAVFARTAGAPGAARGLVKGTGSRIDAEGLRLYSRLITTPAHVSATLAMMARWDLEPLIADLPRLDVPVTLALGLRDRAVPPESTRALAPRFRDASIIEYPDLGHLMHEEAPDRIATLISDAAPLAEPFRERPSGR
jgi:magnesium chelatase accessory protein